MLDYEKVLKLASLIEENSSSQFHHILHSIRDVFGYQYLSLVTNENSFLPSSAYYLSKSAIEVEMNNSFISTRLLRLNMEEEIITPAKRIISGEQTMDMYEDFLNQNQIEHHLFIPLKTETNLLGVLGLYKSMGEQPFTQEEKRLCCYAAKFISANMTRLFELEKLKYANLLLENSINTVPLGVMILNHEYSIIYHNKASKHYSYEMNPVENADSLAITTDFIRAKIEAQTKTNHHADMEFNHKQFSLKIKTVLHSNLQNKNGKKFVVSIYPQMKQRENSLLTRCMELGLSQREAEIIELISAGLSNHEIAKKLFLSINTIKTHIKNIFNKLGVSNRISAIHVVTEKQNEQAIR